MHERRSRKQELTRRIFVYALMTLTMLALLVLFTYRILGYQFNFSTRTVERTGLVQYDSFPRGAQVQIDGKRHDQLTRTKSSVLPGVRQFSMRLDGYHDWQKTLPIEAGTVTWLSYARLVPNEKKVVDMLELGQLRSIKESPDGRYMFGIAMSTDGTAQTVRIDMRDSAQPALLTEALSTLNVSGFTGADTVEHTFTVVAWDSTSRYVTVEHSYTGTINGSEWLWIDRENPTDIINISTLTNLAVTNVRPGKDGEVYILQENGDLRRLTIDNGNVSRPLLAGVTSFELYDKSTIYYTGQRQNQYIAGVWRDNWTIPTVMRQSSSSDDESKHHIAVSSYFYQDTIAVSDGARVTVYRGSLLTGAKEEDAFTDTTFATFTLNRPIERLTISANGRFVVAEDDQGFVTYDLELQSVSQQSKKQDSAVTQWLDDYHVWRVNGAGMLVMQEFDGVNSYELMPVSSGYTALLTHDGKYIYSFVKNEDGTVILKRLAMTVEN